MKNSLNWFFAAILICGLTVSSCKKDPVPTPEPEPTPTQTVLTGMVGTGVPVYDSVTYTYEYDTNYRLVRSEAHNSNDNTVILEYRFTYSEGSINIEGTKDDASITTVCTLDSESRITKIEETSVDNYGVNTARIDLTYDADGRLSTLTRLMPDISSESSTKTFVWEGDELKATDKDNGIVHTEFEVSNVPAQALFSIYGYEPELSELCAQGYFGKTPAHMPSKRTVTTTVSIPGLPPIVAVYDYNYTINEEGHLATCEELGSRTTKYALNWEER